MSRNVKKIDKNIDKIDKNHCILKKNWKAFLPNQFKYMTKYQEYGKILLSLKILNIEMLDFFNQSKLSQCFTSMKKNLR